MIKKFYNNILKTKLAENEKYLNDIRTMSDENFKKQHEIEKLKVENELKGTFLIYGLLLGVLCICIFIGIVSGILEECGIIQKSLTLFL